MGWGDAELCLLCGLYLGISLTAVMLFLAFIMGAAAGIALIIAGKKNRKDMIPFGPFLALGSVLSYLYGQELIQFYQSYFFGLS
jgi:leader peptidase (prepilin peptidase)/N-methyltransferase